MYISSDTANFNQFKFITINMIRASEDQKIMKLRVANKTKITLNVNWIAYPSIKLVKQKE
jgi:hypothetical protein